MGAESKRLSQWSAIQDEGFHATSAGDKLMVEVAVRGGRMIHVIYVLDADGNVLCDSCDASDDAKEAQADGKSQRTLMTGREIRRRLPDGRDQRADLAGDRPDDA